MRLKHFDFIGSRFILVVRYNGLCHLNGAILCLMKEELALKASPEGVQQAKRSEAMFIRLNECAPSDACATSREGK